jgi:hypothetical protein
MGIFSTLPPGGGGGGKSPTDLTGIPPAVVSLFEQLAFMLINKGHEHYSARAILHQIRWHYTVNQGQKDFKCNNNWTPRLSRWFMEKYPQHDEFFEIRSSPSPHDMGGYAGPYAGKQT